MTAEDLLSAALTNLESLEHHIPKLDRPIYRAAVAQIEQARAALTPECGAPTLDRARASFQPLFDD